MSLSDVAQEAVGWRDAIASACITSPEMVEPSADPSFLRSFGRIVRLSRVVIWERDIFTLAQRGMDRFIGLTSLPPEVGMKPLEQQFWFLDNFHLPVTKAECALLNLPAGSVCEALGLFVLPRFGIVSVEFIITPDTKIPRIRMHPMRFPLNKTSAAGAALLCFLHTNIVGTEPVLLARATRRRMAKADEPRPDIRIIRLRRTKNDRATKSESDREWHHQWIVTGHWRRLHQPRKSDGALITFVRAYVKGPETAPLLQPRESVYVVAR